MNVNGNRKGRKDKDSLAWSENILKNEVVAFEVLFKKFYQPLTLLAMQFVQSKEVAEEIVQDVFTDFWEKRSSWIPGNSFRPYLYKVVKNRCLNYLKRQQVIYKYDRQWVEQQEDMVFDFIDEQSALYIESAITKAVESLPERNKLIYNLNRHEGLTYPEIAGLLNVSVKLVESRMTEALKMLRKRLYYLSSVGSVS